MSDEVRVRFDLEVDEEGFPPISAEFLIGKLKSENTAVLDNTPFFVLGVALGDTVRCTGSPPDMKFEALVEESGYKAISVIFVDNSYDDELYQLLKAAGCYVEYGEFPEYNMIAAAIPPKANYDGVRDLLEAAENDGKISFAELCVQ